MVAQGIGIIMVAPAPSREQNAGADQGRQIMRDVRPAARIRQPSRHPANDATGLKNVPQQQHGARVSSEPISSALDPKGPVEAGRDWL